jgi:hypothetical protein
LYQNYPKNLMFLKNLMSQMFPKNLMSQMFPKNLMSQMFLSYRLFR